MKDIKGCPFCGNTDIHGEWNDDNEFEVGCYICQIYAFDQTISKAEKKWNKRVLDKLKKETS